MKLDDIRCVKCGVALNLADRPPTSNPLTCPACGTSYETVWGVPYFGGFEHSDILGLIEIAANTGNRGKFGVTPNIVEGWERLLRAYHDASDKAAFVVNNPEAQSPFLLNRYGEWVEIAHLAGNLDLHGRNVLDIGAGLGFDSHRLAVRGANVTALEFSPLLAEAGNANFPHIRWIGGFSHVLPFKNGSFDAVFCNAALHHMRDIPAVISEALRVLRPSGYLITTCDSFRPSESADDAELEIFDREPAVLLGVNECVPRFLEFVESLQLHAELLDVELFTHTLYDAPSGGTLTDLTPWRLDVDGDMLARRSGSLAMRVRLKHPWPEPARLQKGVALTASQYAHTLTSESAAIARLASLLPAHFVDLPFDPYRDSQSINRTVDGDVSKFELLNGWRFQRHFEYARRAYRRGRWFLRRPSTADALVFTIKMPRGAQEGEIDVVLDARVVSHHKVAADAQSIVVDLSGVAPDHVFALEIRKQGGDESLDGASFSVLERRLIARMAVGAEFAAKSGMVFAVIPVFNRLHFTRECIRRLKAQTYVPLTIIVSDGGSTDGTVAAIKTDFPDVVVLTTQTELWWAGSMAAGIDYALKHSQNDTDFVLMMNNDTEIPQSYVATLANAAREFNAAVGALIVDSKDNSRILDAGEYVDWSSYAFPVKASVEAWERFRDDVDVLPGRGSLVPLNMIRNAGNVDARQFPHYLADYEFFYRLKSHGFRLGVCYDTSISAHIEETGIVPGLGVTSFRQVWAELFSRRSMGNVIDHWRFVTLHAPKKYRVRLQLRLIARTIAYLGLRTPMRPVALPFYWLSLLPSLMIGQIRVFRRFKVAFRERGQDVWCRPSLVPGSIRAFAYFFLSPGPVHAQDCWRYVTNPHELVKQGLLRPLPVEGWFAFSTLKVPQGPVSALLRDSRNLWAKVRRTLIFRKALRAVHPTASNG